MPISTTERQIPGHQRSKRSSVDSLAVGSASHRSAKRISTTETEEPRHRRSGRSTGGSSSRLATAASSPHPTWMILNRVGARRDCFYGDRTTSSTCCTSNGEEISVSFKVVKPPGTSVLTLDWPQGLRLMESNLSYPHVIAADGNVVLFQMTCADKYPSALVDHFVYKASSDTSQQPSLSLLPVRYCKGRSPTGEPLQHIMSEEATGILSCSSKRFVVAELETREDSGSEVDISLLWSGHDKYTVLKRLPVRGVNFARGLFSWSTDAVLPFRNQFLIWVDYYKGMIFADMTRSDKKPRLRHVPLPVVPVRGVPDDWDYTHGCRDASCSLCVTSGNIKFVHVNQHSSSFSITLWSLCSDKFTWRAEAVLNADKLWALDSGKLFPHVQPKFPVVDMENPDAICFMLNDDCHTVDHSDKIWMVKVHMKKQLLGEATAYPKEKIFFDTIKFARITSTCSSFISSEMPRYLYGGQSCTKRRKLSGKEYD